MITSLHFTIPEVDVDEVLVFLMGCMPGTAWADSTLNGDFSVTVTNPRDLPRIKAQLSSQFPKVRFTTVFDA